MATKDKTSKQPVQKKGQTQEPAVEKGYAGSGDYATGKVQSDPSQATNEQLREDRVRQRQSDVVTGEDDE